MERVAIVRALRTPIGKYFGGLSRVNAAQMGTVVVKSLLEGFDAPVDEVVFGCARQAGQGPNPARQIAYHSGIPETVPAQTINMACGSGLKAIELAATQIWLGRARVVVAGGVESMTQVPFLLKKMRTGYRLGHGKLVDDMYDDGFHCRLADQVMGLTAETLAERYDISRAEQDGFALHSQQKAGNAVAEGAFDHEIVPVPVKDGVVDKDEHVRAKTTLERLGRLPPVFKKDGSVHAGNSSGITDGASATLVVAESVVRELGLEALAWFEDFAAVGVDPHIMGIGPVPATRALMERTGRGLGDWGLIELNEAFAAQVLACHRDLEFDMDRLNVHGGAIALGHPIGCTGNRIVVTLLHAMARHGVDKGLATLCVSGGLGVAASFVRS